MTRLGLLVRCDAAGRGVRNIRDAHRVVCGMPSWNTQVIEEFRANDGKVGGNFAGAPIVLVHHRGQLTVYLRQTGALVPAWRVARAEPARLLTAG